jgi:hypothetical protein
MTIPKYKNKDVLAKNSRLIEISLDIGGEAYYFIYKNGLISKAFKTDLKMENI